MSEADFNREYKKNPVNLIRRCHSDVSKPQQRYIFTHNNAVRSSTYLGYKQCLPGSVAIENRTSKVKVTKLSGGVMFVTLTNDILCKAYDGENTKRQLHSSPTTQDNPKPTTQNSPNTTTQNSPKTTTQNTTPKTGEQQGSLEGGNPRDKGKNAYYARAY